MTLMDTIKNELKNHIDEEKAAYLPRFFQAYPGGYGEGDEFLGVTVPNQRKVAKKYYREASLKEIEKLLQDPIHECRLTALFMMTYKYEKARDEGTKEAIIVCYLKNLTYVNNWDLVDSSAYKLLGPHLENSDRDLLYELAVSDSLWDNRVAIITTLHFIRNHDFEDTLKLAEILLEHPHDLIHKATGWMLREVGKRDIKLLRDFLDRYCEIMPRTMLRYAIEKLEPEERKRYMEGNLDLE